MTANPRNDERSDNDGGPGDDDAPGYAQALAELDQILRELDGADVDVDRLAERVRRAAGLIEVCRHRIDGARLQIDSVIADLDAAGARREHGDAADSEPA